MESGSLEDGVFRCSFRRVVKVENNSMIFDLNKDWFLIFSKGQTANESKFVVNLTMLFMEASLKELGSS